MINAEEAKRVSDAKVLANDSATLTDIENKIKQASERGEYAIHYHSDLSKGVKLKLDLLKFKYKLFDGGYQNETYTTISWT